MKLTAGQRRAMRRKLDRWLDDEAYFDAVKGDRSEFSDLTEIMRNLGSAIAYLQGVLNKDKAATVAFLEGER